MVIKGAAPFFYHWILPETVVTYLYTTPQYLNWHSLFGIEPIPGGLEPPVLTIILREDILALGQLTAHLIYYREQFAINPFFYIYYIKLF